MYKPLTTALELREKCKRNGINLIGIYYKDRLPPKIQNGAYIINLDNYPNTGTHWIALYVHDKDVYYFDSFGLPCPREIERFIRRRTCVFEMLTDDLQSIRSGGCGDYCILWLRYMTENHNRGYYRFVNNFYENVNYNLTVLKQLIK